ncbi:hypothetical protein BH23BAC1_BH23BAC1_09000 [soil metagenome]
MIFKFKLYQLFAYFLIALGFIFSIFQFAYNRSLWLDEASLALNIIDKSPAELLKPLDFNQVAPILYLQITKLFSILIPDSEYGLRLFSLICYLLSLILIYKLSNILIKNKYVRLLTLAFFVFNPLILYFSNEVKQYMGDVFVVVLFLFLTLKSYLKIRIKYIIISIIGAICIFLSNITIVIMIGVGLSLFYLDFIKYRRIKIKYFISLTLVWLVSFTFYYFLFIDGHPTKEIMVNYWNNSNAFLPANPFRIEFYLFSFQKLKMISNHINIFPNIIYLNVFLFCSLTLAALWTLLTKKKWDIILILFIPILVHLLLSAFQLYPFHLRLILYTFPLFFIVLPIGLEAVINRSFFLYPKLSKVIILSVIILMGLSFFNTELPIKNEEIKQAIDFIERNKKAEDKIYIYYGARRSFEYYTKSGFVHFNNHITFGSSSRAKKQDYLEEIYKLEGDYWFLFSHVAKDEETYIIYSLDSLGFMRKNSFMTTGASAYLYEINH